MNLRAQFTPLRLRLGPWSLFAIQKLPRWLVATDAAVGLAVGIGMQRGHTTSALGLYIVGGGYLGGWAFREFQASAGPRVVRLGAGLGLQPSECFEPDEMVT